MKDDWFLKVRIRSASDDELPKIIRSMQADAIRSAAKLTPFEGGRFVQVQDVIELAEEVEKGTD